MRSQNGYTTKNKYLETKCIICYTNINIHVNTINQNKLCIDCIPLHKKSSNFYNVSKTCKCCGKDFIAKRKTYKTCGKECTKILQLRGAQHGGRKSVSSQSTNRRSQNEILFANKCKIIDPLLSTNTPLFNGWDADVILPTFKVAVLWNGAWHYNKITKQHSVTQVQNRDKIKIDEIIKSGFVPYIIKDMGKYNPKFVNEQFLIFANWLKEKKLYTISI
jgi:hypothetical protein